MYILYVIIIVPCDARVIKNRTLTDTELYWTRELIKKTVTSIKFVAENVRIIKINHPDDPRVLRVLEATCARMLYI